MSYFVSGWWHFAAAMAFAVSLQVLSGRDAVAWLWDWPFVAGLIASSSALFVLPDRWSRRGAGKFLRYPLPDWDVLLLGPASHRNWLTHSPLLALGLALVAWSRPEFLSQSSALGEFWWSLMTGLCVGWGSHLFWDCVGSQRHAIVVIPHWWTLRAAPSRIFLLSGALTSFMVAMAFANREKLGL